MLQQSIKGVLLVGLRVGSNSKSTIGVAISLWLYKAHGEQLHIDAIDDVHHWLGLLLLGYKYRPKYLQERTACRCKHASHPC